MRAFLVGLSALLLTASCAAEPTDGDTSDVDVSEHAATGLPPYDTMEGLRDDALKTALFDVIKDHKRLGYDKARTVLFTKPGFVGSDGKLECVYTGRKVAPNGSTSVGDMNTEHSWPQSHGASREPARSDLHHLFVVDSVANSARGNWDFGKVLCLHDNGLECSFEKAGSALGKDDANAWKFEVREEKRGDIARAHFYFAIRYNLHIVAKEEATLRQWNIEDPVDDYERSRNDAIQGLQNNRNPFVDRPDFVDHISDY